VTEDIPFLRVADAEASARWYARLGFDVEWTHRFAEGLPLFAAIQRDGARIFLSEHTGDARPDTLLYIFVDDVDTIAREFAETVRTAEYGMREVELKDPDDNRLRFGQR
jgi:catechol 2,3-dioxygenase-like lactoylglutathione lyase family enzyme